MNKKNTRKGFTIVELVIVIAVIAILATVLVPTFGDVISKANDSKKIQAVKNAYTTYTVENADKEGYTDDIIIKYGDAFYSVTNGSVVNEDGELVSADEPTDEGAVYWDANESELVIVEAEEDPTEST